MANYGVKQRIFWRLRQGERKFILIFGDVISSLIALFIALYFWARESGEWLTFLLAVFDRTTTIMVLLFTNNLDSSTFRNV